MVISLKNCISLQLFIIQLTYFESILQGIFQKCLEKALDTEQKKIQKG